MASQTTHREVYYGSFKWLTNGRFASGKALSDSYQGSFEGFCRIIWARSLNPEGSRHRRCTPSGTTRTSLMRAVAGGPITGALRAMFTIGYRPRLPASRVRANCGQYSIARGFRVKPEYNRLI